MGPASQTFTNSEVGGPHSITSSARSRNVKGNVKQVHLSVFRNGPNNCRFTCRRRVRRGKSNALVQRRSWTVHRLRPEPTSPVWIQVSNIPKQRPRLPPVSQMLLACEHDRATGHFSIGAAYAPSGAMAAANKLNHEMNTRAEIIFMISSKKKLLADRPSMVLFSIHTWSNLLSRGSISCWLLTMYSGLPLSLLPGAISILGLASGAIAWPCSGDSMASQPGTHPRQ
jgi:hypothetical protein